MKKIMSQEQFNYLNHRDTIRRWVSLVLMAGVLLFGVGGSMLPYTYSATGWTPRTVGVFLGLWCLALLLSYWFWIGLWSLVRWIVRSLAREARWSK